MGTRFARSMLACGAAVALSLTSYACGDDDDDTMTEPDAGMSMTGGSGGSGGSGGMGSTGGTGTTGGSGGMMATGGTGGFPTPTCDTSITPETSCGGTTCPTLGMFASFVCAITCCTEDDTCGTRRVPMGGDPTDCAPPATPDPDCPDYVGAMSTMDGCCAPSGRCGAISGADMSCITSSTLLPDLMPGPECSGGDVDGGI